MKEILKKLYRSWAESNAKRMVSVQGLSTRKFLDLFDIREVNTLREKGDIRSAQAALLRYYEQKVTKVWLSPPKIITDLRLDTNKYNKEQLIYKAECILDHQLSPTGIKPKLLNNGKIDWRFDAASSREWLLMLNRHAWWPVLGLAYKHTKDERYATAFVTQLRDWIENNPPPIKRNEQSATWRLMEVGLRLRVSWIPTFKLFYESLNFSDEAKIAMLRSMYDHARFLYLFKTSRNHLLRESNGLACISSYFSEFKEAKQWLETALTRLNKELRKQVNQDGSHIEMSTGYQWLVIDEFEKTYELLQEHNLSLPKDDLGEWLEKMYNLLARVILPNGTFPQINDGFILWSKKRLIEAGKMLNRKDFVYIGTEGRKGDLPKETSVAFKDAGLFIMRSDWNDDARYLLFDAGPYGGPHGHEDKLSIVVYAYGKSFIVDPGSYTYESSDPFRQYFVGSQGHNTVLVDGQSQIRRWHKEHMSPRPVTGKYALWHCSAEFDYVESTYNEGYGPFDIMKPKNVSIIDKVVHTRKILFAKPDYWVIVDQLRAPDLHKYQILFHTSPDLSEECTLDNRVKLISELNGPGLSIVPVNSENLTINSIRGSEDPIQGWYSPDHHKKVPSTTVLLESEPCKSTAFITLLYPYPSGSQVDEVNVQPLDIAGNENLAILVSARGGKDYIMFSCDSSNKEFGAYQSRSRVAVVRTNSKGKEVNRFDWAGE